MKKANVLLNKPVYIGFCVLELAKLHMYEIFYDNFKAFYGKRCTLWYTDTDSLIMHIQTKDVYTDLRCNYKSIMDTSNYPKQNISYKKKK